MKKQKIAVIRPNPIYPWMDPIHVQLWLRLMPLIDELQNKGKYCKDVSLHQVPERNLLGKCLFPIKMVKIVAQAYSPKQRNDTDY